MTPSLLVEALGDGIWQVTLNRPEKRNALDAAHWEALSATLHDLAADGDAACLILTGAGSAFASGGDIAAFSRDMSAPDGPCLFRQRIERCLEALSDFPAPTVARVNGHAIGGGLELALACDVRIASDAAQFAMPAASFGMVMAFPDFRRLAAAVGADGARYLAMTGALIGAEEAQRMGLAHRVVSADRLSEETLQIARRLARGERSALLWFRAAANLVTSGDEPTEGFRRFEVDCLVRQEFRLRVDEFLARRRPRASDATDQKSN